ncbi:MAG: response regulator [Phycisphaerales bacterium]|nr:response regulator [Phycisphaerales bacterium]
MATNASNAQPVVLCVDDDADTLKFVKVVLSGFGCRVLTAEDGQQALRTLEQQHVDVLVCDAQMPGMPGTEVIRTVRLIAPHVRSILLSAHCDDVRTVTEAVNISHVDQLVPKPFDIKEIRRAVQAVLTPLQDAARRACASTAQQPVAR